MTIFEEKSRSRLLDHLVCVRNIRRIVPIVKNYFKIKLLSFVQEIADENESEFSKV